MDRRGTKGELQDMYYIPDIRIRVISYGKLFSQGWEIDVGCYGFTLHNQKETLLRKHQSEITSSVTLRMTHPDFSLSACREVRVKSKSKSNVLVEFEKWVKLMGNGTIENSRTVMF